MVAEVPVRGPEHVAVVLVVVVEADDCLGGLVPVTLRFQELDDVGFGSPDLGLVFGREFKCPPENARPVDRVPRDS